MKVKKVVVLADQAQVARSILPGLEQLGLQICDQLPGQGTDCLLICDMRHVTTPRGALLIRQALVDGCPVLLDNANIPTILEEIKQTGGLSLETRNNLEAYALFRCLQSDSRRLFALQAGTNAMPRYAAAAYEKVQDLRYGENWHQKAALYSKENGLGLHTTRKLNGREMSYNNMVDAETVLEMLIDLSEYDGIPAEKPLSVIVKHANPCGVAYGESLAEAYRLSFATDPKSAFGGVIGFSRRGAVGWKPSATFCRRLFFPASRAFSDPGL